MIAFDIPQVRRKSTVEYPLRLGDRMFKLEIRCATIETPEVKQHLFTRAERPAINPDAPVAERDEAVMADKLDIIGRCCLVTWDATAGGQPVECTPENAVEFLQRARAAFPEEIRQLAYFAENPANFREPIADAEAVGKK